MSVFKAVIHGFFASIFITSLIGHTVGRQIVLKEYKIAPIIMTSITGFEKSIVFFVSGLLAFLCSILLFEPKWMYQVFKIDYIFQLFVVMILILVALKFTYKTNFEKKFYENILTYKSLRNFIFLILFSTAIQLITIKCFIIGFFAVDLNVALFKLVTASIIISFLSSLPISVNGWGIRELSSIYFYGLVGVQQEFSLAIAVSVGICSTITIFLFYFLSNFHTVKSNFLNKNNKRQQDIIFEKSCAYIITIGIAILIFFQIHLSMFGTLININLSDPIAIISLCFMIFKLIYLKQIPNWRIPYFNLILITLTFLVFLSYLNSFYKIGFSEWALISRFFGWFVLIGYLSVGIITVNYLKNFGRIKFFEVMIITGACIVITHFLARFVNIIYFFNSDLLHIRFEGFAANPNAFALQMMICSIILIILSNYKKKIGSFSELKMNYNNLNFEKVYLILHAICLTGLFISGSRAAMGICAIYLILSTYLNFLDIKNLFKTLLYTAFIYVIFTWLIPYVTNITIDYIQTFYDISVRELVLKQTVFFYSPTSDNVRLETIIRGLKLWLENPFIGSGLGVFHYLSSTAENGANVIHSTPIWLLAEFGIIGFVIFSICFIWVVYFLILKKIKTVNLKITFMILIVFLAFCIVHEILYQRIIWLVLGMSLAIPFKTKQ